MPGNKQPRLGILPRGWTERRLGEIGEALIGLTYSPNDVAPDGRLVLRSSNVADGALRFEDNVFVNMEVPERAVVREGDILVCARNGSRDLIGKCAKIDTRADGMAFGAFMAIFRTSYHEFVYYQFQSESLKRQIHEHLGATINQITNASLNSFRIAIPDSEAERHAIAAALSDVDALLLKLDQLIAKKRDLKLGAMQELLTGQTRLPGFSGQWQRQRLGDVGTFSKGSGIKKDQVLQEGIPCVRYGELYTRHEDHIRQFYSFISPEIARESQLLRRGDLLFAGSGETAEEIGKCVAFLGAEEAYAGGDIVIFRPRQQDSMYLGYLMNHPSVVAQKARMGQGDAVVHISARNLATLEVIIPEFAEQVAIAAVISDLDADITALVARRDKTLMVKQGMLQELLTGRIRLV